jgi:NTE family protein
MTDDIAGYERSDAVGESAPASRCVCIASGELGVALSGGGSNALAQLGVLKVLERSGIPVSYVAGTSGGAVIGAVYVTSRNATEAEHRILTHLRTSGTGFNIGTFAAFGGRAARPASVLDAMRAVWRARRGKGALVAGEDMRRSLHQLLGPATFDTTRLPFATAALDLVTGRRMIFAGGPLVDAVYASSAIPGLFEPFRLEGHVLVDGGWAEPVPVNTCHHLGAIHVLAVDVCSHGAPEGVRGPLGSALHADAAARQLLEEAQLGEADFVVRPDMAPRHFADFSEPEELIAGGERAAEASLRDIAGVLERHRSLFVRRPGREGGAPQPPA